MPTNKVTNNNRTVDIRGIFSRNPVLLGSERVLAGARFVLKATLHERPPRLVSRHVCNDAQ